MVGAGGAIINYLFPGAREAPESKGAENIVSMEDIRLEQGLHEECGVFGIYDPEGSCAQTTYYGPVSYTHLDVYKRQPVRGAGTAQPGQ